MTKRVLITGGAGYIGSNVALSLLEAGHEVTCLDDHSLSTFDSPRRLRQLFPETFRWCFGSVLNSDVLRHILTEHSITTVVHCAGKKAVGESASHPVAYFHSNVGGLTTLLHAMETSGVRQLLFSSSATVYGETASLPITEDAPIGTPSSNYGSTKIMCENILNALDSTWKIGILRFFNPIGAHRSGYFSDNPKAAPNNVVPILLSRYREGKPITIFGNDYPTPDGTCLRDYVHVTDVAEGHLRALEALGKGSFTLNLGTGRATSVLELVAAFNQYLPTPLAVEFAARRPGDVAALYASASRAKDILGWEARFTLDDMCKDTLNTNSK